MLFSTLKNNMCLCVLFVVIMSTLTACGRSDDAQKFQAENSENGSVAFQIVLVGRDGNATQGQTKAFSNCHDINTVTVIILDGNQRTIAEESWNCSDSDRKGTIDGISPGLITIMVQGIYVDTDGGRSVFYQGRTLEDILIRAGETKEVGPIACQLVSPELAGDADQDGDGFTPKQHDCNDLRDDIYPDAADECGDGIDQDCNPDSCSIELPRLVDLTQAEAESEIRRIEMVVGTITRECSDTVPSGAVIRQAPISGIVVQYGTAINLVVSAGFAPVADAGDPETVHIGDLVTLNGSGSTDKDGDTLTYNWEITDPSGNSVYLPDESLVSLTFTPEILGSYEIRLTVKDGFATSSDTVTITAANVTPVADAGNSVAVHVSDTVTLSGIGSRDEDGDTLTYDWQIVRPSGSRASLVHPTSVQPEFTPDVLGRYEVRLTVYDGFENSEPSVVTITAFLSTVSDTGQTTCYDEAGASIACPSEGEEYFGQDANYFITPASYTKLDSNGNALSASSVNWTMVKDNVTGLMWEVKTDDGGIHDKGNQYTWQNARNVFIAQLNADGFGGYSDWRLPTPMELGGIVDYGTYAPAVDTDYFVNTNSANYWTSTTSANFTDYAWLVYFNNGLGHYDGIKSNVFFVRAVRGEIFSGGFTDNGDGTVTDNATNLMWMQATSETIMTWKTALAYCENLTLAGYSDWRLPTLKELRSIVDYSNYYNPAIDTTYFPDTESSFYWTSTTNANVTDNAWLVLFSNGVDYYGRNKANAYSVRAVRGGQ